MASERDELEQQFFDCLKERLVRYEGLKALALLVGERIAARDADAANSLLLKQQEYINEIRAIEEKEAQLRKRLQARFGLLPEQSLDKYLIGEVGGAGGVGTPGAATRLSAPSSSTRQGASSSSTNPGPIPTPARGKASAAARAREDFRARLIEASGKIATVLESLIKITNENEAGLRASLGQVRVELLDFQRTKAAQRAYRGSSASGHPEARFVDKKR